MKLIRNKLMATAACLGMLAASPAKAATTVSNLKVEKVKTTSSGAIRVNFVGNFAASIAGCGGTDYADISASAAGGQKMLQVVLASLLSGKSVNVEVTGSTVGPNGQMLLTCTLDSIEAN